MLKNVLARIGLGATEVDTLVDDPRVPAGGALSGRVTITGGDVEQVINGIHLELITRCIVEVRGDQKVHAEITVSNVKVGTGMTVRPGDHHDLPFRLQVPEFAPLSVGSTRTTLRTRLDVPSAIDPRDSDAVTVAPNPAMLSVFEGLERAGFRLAEVEVEHNPRQAVPFVQEFDFRPTRFADWGIEEVEIAFRPAGRGALEVLVTVDRRGGLFSFGGETGYRFRVPAEGADPQQVAAAVREAIGR